MKQEIIPTFEQARELSYLNTLFDMVVAGKTKIKALNDAIKDSKDKQKVLMEEVEKVYKQLNGMGLSDFMIQKNVHKEHKYKFIYFLRNRKNN